MASSTIDHQQQQQLNQNAASSAAAELPSLNNNQPQQQQQGQQGQGNLQYSLSQISIQQESGGASSTLQAAGLSKENLTTKNLLLGQGEWHPAAAQLCAYHDCKSIGYAWALGASSSSLNGPTGASQAQSPSEDDAGDGKFNELLDNCPAFRNELGNEPTRRVALSKFTCFQLMSTAEKMAQQRPAENLPLETWHREHTASEISVLEDVSQIYFGARMCAGRQPKIVVEPQDMGSYYYRHCFVGRPHVEYCGMDESLGPIVISMVREESKEGSNKCIIIYRLILRISDVLTMRVAVPEEALSSDSSQQQDSRESRSTRLLMRDLLETVCPQIHFGCLRPAINMPKVEDLLLKIDEQPIYTRYKVGVLFCNDGQATEEQMYNNEEASEQFEEFLDFLGSKVRLKAFDGYKGGLDTKGDSTGLYSLYTEHHSSQIMFHVSTMLPFTPNNKQQLARKRHIGNDMVTIVFQMPDALPFSPITVRSHFQHVFIVIRVMNPQSSSTPGSSSEPVYRVAVSRAKDVPPFGPPLASTATYHKNAEFKEFLLTKIINAENAVHRSRKFASMASRTRREALKEVVENYAAAHHANEGASRIASRLLGGGSMKRRERTIPKPVLDVGLRAAISWHVEVYDYTLKSRVPAVLGLSADTLVLLDPLWAGLTIFATPTHSILGWIQLPDGGLKIFYDMLLLWCITTDGSERESCFLLKRLMSVTNGDEAKEAVLRKAKPSEAFGFTIQEEGIVTEVDMNASAWRGGLRQGSRIVEIENMALITYTQQQVSELLVERIQLKITIISPASDGNPRRGCEDTNCPVAREQETQAVTTETRPAAFSLSASCPDSDRKKHSAPAFGGRMAGQNSRIPFSKSSVDSSVPFKFSSSDDKKNSSSTMLGRARSDDVQPMTASRDGVNVQNSSSSNTLKSTDSKQSLGASNVEETFLLHSITPQGSSVSSTLLLSDQHHNSGNSRRTSVDVQEQQNSGGGQQTLQALLDERVELRTEVQQLRALLAAEQRAHETTRRQLHLVTEYCERFSIIPLPEEQDEEL